MGSVSVIKMNIVVHISKIKWHFFGDYLPRCVFLLQVRYNNRSGYCSLCKFVGFNSSSGIKLSLLVSDVAYSP